MVGWEIAHELPRWSDVSRLTFASISPHRALVIKGILGVIPSGHKVVLVWSKISVRATLDEKMCTKAGAGS